MALHLWQKIDLSLVYGHIHKSHILLRNVAVTFSVVDYHFDLYTHV